MSLHVFNVSAFGMYHIKTIDVLRNVVKILKAREMAELSNAKAFKQQAKSQYKKKYMWLFKKIDDEKNQKESFEMKIVINNAFDVCIRLREIPDKDIALNPEMGSSEDNISQSEDDNDLLKTIYYFEHRVKNLNMSELQKKKIPHSLEKKLERDIQRARHEFGQRHFGQFGTEQEAQQTQRSGDKDKDNHDQHLLDTLIDPRTKIYETQEEHEKGFTMNTQYIFFWDKRSIHFFDIDQDFNDDEKKGNLGQLTLRIDEREPDSCIIEVRVGSNKNRIAIIVQQEKDALYTIFSWNVRENSENDANDVRGDYEILWDYLGNFYIVHDDNKVNFVQEQCQVLAFKFQSVSELNASR